MSRKFTVKSEIKEIKEDGTEVVTGLLVQAERKVKGDINEARITPLFYLNDNSKFLLRFTTDTNQVSTINTNIIPDENGYVYNNFVEGYTAAVYKFYDVELGSRYIQVEANFDAEDGLMDLIAENLEIAE